MKRRLFFYGVPVAIIAFLVWAAKPWYGATDVASSSTQAIAEIEQLSRPLRTALFQHWAQNEYSSDKSYRLEEFEPAFFEKFGAKKPASNAAKDLTHMWPPAFTKHSFGYTAVLPAAFQPQDTPLIWFEVPESELGEIFRITWSGDGEILNQESLADELAKLRERGYPSDAIFDRAE